MGKYTTHSVIVTNQIFHPLLLRKLEGCHYMLASSNLPGWWFQIFFIFTRTWGNDAIRLIFFRWVETTNQLPTFFTCPVCFVPVAHRCNAFKAPLKDEDFRREIHGTPGRPTPFLHASQKMQSEEIIAN